MARRSPNGKMEKFEELLEDRRYHLALGHLREINEIKREVEANTPGVIISALISQRLPRPQIVRLIHQFNNNKKTKKESKDDECEDVYKETETESGHNTQQQPQQLQQPQQPQTRLQYYLAPAPAQYSAYQCYPWYPYQWPTLPPPSAPRPVPKVKESTKK